MRESINESPTQNGHSSDVHAENKHQMRLPGVALLLEADHKDAEGLEVTNYQEVANACHCKEK